MSVFDVLKFVLGISLFLFGIHLMGDSLKRSAGGRLKKILGKMTTSPFRGFLLGASVTAIIQSSSATTVMIVGFVNAGSMLLSEAVGVIMGANVGTAATSWLTAFSSLEGGGNVSGILEWLRPSSFTPIVALAGVWFYMRGKDEKRRGLGLIFLGFSVLMLGMDTASAAVRGLSESEGFRSILLAFENPILGLLAGLVLTAVIQSSSASIGILQSFTVTGAITFGNAVPIIMGQNIGTCVTALLASVGTGKNAKRASMIHLLFNVIGSVLCLSLFYFVKLVFAPPILNGTIDMWGIALVHTLFNLITFLALFPFSRTLERLSILLVREGKEGNRFNALDERLIETPVAAIGQSRRLVIEMAERTTLSISDACSLFGEFSEKKARRVREGEIAADEYEDRVGSYLVRVSEHSTRQSEGKEIHRLLHWIGDLERISDHTVNLVESAEEMRDKELRLPEGTTKELSVIMEAVGEIGQRSLEAIRTERLEGAAEIEPLEEVIDRLRDEIRARNIRRLQSKESTMEQSFVLSDILTDLERIADHCSNLAACVLDDSEELSVGQHQVLRQYRQEAEHARRFEEKRKFYEQKYRLEGQNK